MASRNRSGLNRSTPHVNTAGSPRRQTGQGRTTTVQPGQKVIKSKGSGPAVVADSGKFVKGV